jgi:hypothetical protein
MCIHRLICTPRSPNPDVESHLAFPVARDGTAHAGTGHGWVATDDGVAMVCADEPVSYLLLSDDARRLERLETAVRRALPDLAGLGPAVTWPPG